MKHPSEILFPGETPFPILPAVDHYAGSEKLMKKALQLQNELGPIFDITCDCKNGSYKIVQGIETTDYSREKIRKNIQELLDEAAAVKDML